MKNETTKIENNDCLICGHSKDKHKSRMATDATGKKSKHVSCRVIVKREKFDMPEFGISSIGKTCSCGGFKPNTMRKKAIKKYQKFLKKLPDTVDNLYRRKKVKDAIKGFRKTIKENPENLLHWQKKVTA